MSLVVVNSAVVNGYTYAVGPGLTGTASTTPVEVQITVLPATIDFSKTHSSQHIDLGGSSTITYSITNKNTENMTAATITDLIFSLKGVSISTITGGTLKDNTITVNLPSGGLAQNTNTKVTFTVTVDANATPSKTLYDTDAIGNFTINTIPNPSITTKTVNDTFEVNSARLIVTKNVSPNVPVITSGNTLTYTLNITNSGNVEALIPPGAFVDTWTEGGLKNVHILDSNEFIISGYSIINSKAISIPPQGAKIVTCTFTATANA